MIKRKATIIKQDGEHHWKLKDDTGALHWIMTGYFDEGAPREDGARVMIVKRDDGIWHVSRGL